MSHHGQARRHPGPCGPSLPRRKGVELLAEKGDDVGELLLRHAVREAGVDAPAQFDVPRQPVDRVRDARRGDHLVTGPTPPEDRRSEMFVIALCRDLAFGEV